MHGTLMTFLKPKLKHKMTNWRSQTGKNWRRKAGSIGCRSITLTVRILVIVSIQKHNPINSNNKNIVFRIIEQEMQWRLGSIRRNCSITGNAKCLNYRILYSKKKQNKNYCKKLTIKGNKHRLKSQIKKWMNKKISIVKIMKIRTITKPLAITNRAHPIHYYTTIKIASI